MPKMNIDRKVSINAPAEKVYAVLSNFNEWTPWSPWLLMEPEAEVTVAEDARSYEWNGSRVGSGNMKILEEKANAYIKYDLNFLTPWKSHAFTAFSLDEKEGKTDVTWTMDSSLPFFMFFMKKMMEAYVGADYERGLDMLKVYVETGSVPSQLQFSGTSNYSGCHWVGVSSHCSIDETEKQMPVDFEKINKYAEEHNENIAGEPLTIYHKWDIPKNKVSYTAAIQVKEAPTSLPDGMKKGEIPAIKNYVLEHKGRYQHLGNAWSTLYTMMRNKEFKYLKGVHPFELYKNNPSETPESELITEIHFPVK